MTMLRRIVRRPAGQGRLAIRRATDEASGTDCKFVGRSRRVGVINNEMPQQTTKSTGGGGDLLTAEEVAALLRVTPAWVYAQTRRHRIPHLRLGRYVRYRHDALIEWMEHVEEASSALPRRSSPPRRSDGAPVRFR